MQKILTSFKKGWLVLVVLVLTFSLLGFFISWTYCKDPGSKLVINFKYNITLDIDASEFEKKENIDKVKNLEYSMYTGNSVSTYKNADIKIVTASKIDDYYQIKVNADAFNKEDGTRNEATAKGFMRNLTLVVVEDYVDLSLYPDRIETKTNKDGTTYDVTIKGVSDLFDVSFYNENSLNEAGNLIFEASNYNRNGYIILATSIGFAFGLILSITLIIILGLKYSDRLNKESIYDNELLFATPLHKKYWKLSASELKSVRKIVIIALLLALTLASKLIVIPSGFGALGFRFGLIFLSVVGLIGGPVPALIVGAISDILGYFLFESASGAFNPLFTLSAMTSCFIYGICFYRCKISFTRCLIARVLVSIFCNLGLELIGQIIVYDYTFDFIFLTSLPKQIAYLIPQSLMIYIILVIVSPIASQSNFIDERIGENISIF